MQILGFEISRWLVPASGLSEEHADLAVEMEMAVQRYVHEAGQSSKASCDFCCLKQQQYPTDSDLHFCILIYRSSHECRRCFISI